MEELKNKTILMLAQNFFGYELEIKKELENLGANVIYFDERPKNDFFTKVFIRLDLKYFVSRKIKEYYQNIIKTIKKDDIDYLFLINVETVPFEFIKKIKKINPRIVTLTYSWDSIKNRKESLSYLDISNKYFTFDSSDINLNQKIKFLPLFYINNYKDVANFKNELIYDISFVGTVHSDRYKIIKKIEEQSKGLNLKTYFYFYSPSKILFFFQKIFKKDFRFIKWKDVSFESLNKSDVINIIGKSKCIIDIQHPLQIGLTMRTIEMLGAKKKLFTSNTEVQKYDFYKKSNISIINRNNPQIDFDFLTECYEDIDDNYYEKYSLKNWIKTIFGEL